MLDLDLPSESTGDSGGTSLDTWEESIQDSLTGKQGEVGRLLLGYRSRCSYRPELHHLVFGLFTLELGFEHDVLGI